MITIAQRIPCVRAVTFLGGFVLRRGVQAVQPQLVHSLHGN